MPATPVATVAAGAKRPPKVLSEPKATSHRRPVTVTIQWVGGAEPWVRITTAEGVYLRPGTMPLWQLVLYVNGWR
jgi:hypothetical protein